MTIVQDRVILTFKQKHFHAGKGARGHTEQDNGYSNINWTPFMEQMCDSITKPIEFI